MHIYSYVLDRTHIEGRKISMAHTQTDNLAYIFSMVCQAVKNDISNKAASHCQSVAVCLLWVDDFAAAFPFLDALGQIQHWLAPCEVLLKLVK